MTETSVTEGNFLQLIVQAGRAFIAAKDMDPSEEGRDLAAFLRSDAVLGEAERELLAQLVLGEWRNRVGRPTISDCSPRVIEVVKRLRDLVSEGWPKEAAKEQVAVEWNIKRATVEHYERLRLSHEAAVIEAKQGSIKDRF